MNQKEIQQAAHEEAWDPKADKVKINTINMRIDPTMTQKQETYQVILDTIKNTTFYKAFLATKNIDFTELIWEDFHIKSTIGSLLGLKRLHGFLEVIAAQVSISQTTEENGIPVTKISTPITAEEKTKKKNDVKARGLLLMALPNEHQLTFNQYSNAKSMFAAIETRFGGNADTKKTQKTLLKQQYENFNATSAESLDSIFNRLQKIVISAASSSVNTASPQVSTTSVSDNTVYAFMVENLNGSNVLHQDLEQIHKDDLEAMDLKWQLSLLSSVKIVISWDTLPKSVEHQEARKVSFDWSDMAEEQVQTTMALMVFSDLENEVLLSEEVDVLKREVGIKQYEINTLKTEFEKLKLEKDATDFKIEKFNKASKDLDQLLGSQITDKSKKGFGYSAVPLPHPLIYNRPNKLDQSYSGLEEFKEPEFRGYGPENSNKESNVVCENESDNSKENSDNKSVNEVEPKKVRKNNDAPIIEDWVSDDEEEDEPKPKSEKKIVIPTTAKKEFIKPEPVKRTPVNTVRPRVVNTARPNRTSVNAARANGFNAVKSLAYWVWRPTKSNGASLAFKRQNYIDARGRSKLVMAWDGDADDVDVHLYRSMIGSLMYLTASRPDIMFAVCACARFQVTPKPSNLLAVKRIVRYLKGKPTLGLWYSRDSPFKLVDYTDSDYARATLDRKSTTRGCQFLGNRLISWQCKKQIVVATSTTEAEYVAAASCCGQVGDEVVHKELGNRMERAATTASSLEAEQDSGSGPRCQDTILGDVNAQTRFEITSKQSIDPPLLRGYTLGSGEDINDVRLKLLMSVLVSAVKRMLILPVQVSAVEGIIDFLKASSVSYALTVNLVIYTSCIEQFWATIEQFWATAKKDKPSKKAHSQEAEVPRDEAEHEESVPTPSNDPQTCAKVVKLKEIAALKKWIQRLERRKMSRPTGLKRLSKVGMSRRVESSKDQESLRGQMMDLMFESEEVLEDDVMHVEANVDGKDEQSTKPNDSTTGKAVTTASIDDSDVPTTMRNPLCQIFTDCKATKPKVVTIAATIATTTRPKDRGVIVQVLNSQAKLDAELLEERKASKEKRRKKATYIDSSNGE
ncbi:hypothetical protein Tco_0366493 [Tanacetum coccineum]